MSSLHRRRWIALLALPLLVGALLLMHGLDVGGSTTGLHGESEVEAAHPHHGEAPVEHHDEGCDGCAVAHVMVACVAIVASGMALHLVRRPLSTRVAPIIDAGARRLLAARERVRPPEPAWVRLAVMRC